MHRTRRQCLRSRSNVSGAGSVILIVSRNLEHHTLMGNQNRKATKQEIAKARRVIREAFPDFVPVFGAHGDYGGHRAPRDHTIAFRLQDEHGKFRSNVIWVMPDWLGSLTIADVQAMVARSNGKR